MTEHSFEASEMAKLAAFCAHLPAEHRCVRRRGPGGKDIIEIEVGECPSSVRLMKANGAYALTGFDGWGLVIFEDLPAMIGLLENRLLRRKARVGPP